MTPSLARRALRTLVDLLDGVSLNGAPRRRGCTECHCSDCLKEPHHDCALTRLLDDLRDAAGRETP